MTALDAAGGTARSTFTLTVTARPSTYTFFGYLSPLMTVGTDAQPSVSGVFNLGSAIPLKWQLKEGTTFVSDLRTLRTVEAVPGTASPANSACLPNGGAAIQLLDPVAGKPTGNSTYRYDATGKQFIFNWDTSAQRRSTAIV